MYIYIYVVYILYILYIYVYTYVCIYIHMYIQISSIYIFKYINQPETGIDSYMIKNYYSKQWWIQFHFLKMLWSTMQCTITLSLVSNIGCKTIFWITEMESEKSATLYLLFFHQITISPEPLVKKCLPNFLHELVGSYHTYWPITLYWYRYH